MFDWSAIYLRYFEAYEVERSADLARIIGVAKQTAHSWKVGKSHVPWRRMRKLVREKSVSWDWLLEGQLPKFQEPMTVISEHFEWDKINRRFLRLFPDKRQHSIAEQLGVAQETVSKWHRNEMHVPWEKLRYAVYSFSVTWGWLIDGLDN